MSFEKVINPIEVPRLQELITIREMLSNDYLTDPTNAQTAFLVEKYFNFLNVGQSEERLALLNLSYSLPALISEKFAYYTGEPSHPFDKKLRLNQFVQAFSWAGYSVMKARLVDSEMVIEYAAPDGYIKNGDGSEQLFTYLTVYDPAADLIKRFVFRQTYMPGTIQNDLFAIPTNYTSTVNTVDQSPTNFILKQINQNAVRVPLDTLPATAGFVPVEQTGLSDRNPLVVTRDLSGNNRKYGDSTINKVRPLISSIEVQAVNIQDQFLKHLQAKLAIPTQQLSADKKGNVNLSNLQVIGMNPGDPVPTYVRNTNELMGHAFEGIEKLLRQISAVTSLPFEFLGIDAQGGAESLGTKELRLSPFIKKIEGIQAFYKESLKELIEIGEAWGVEEVRGSEADLSITFPEVFPTNKKNEADELTVALDARLISRKRAIMRYNNMTEEEAEAELEDIGIPEPSLVNNQD